MTVFLISCARSSAPPERALVESMSQALLPAGNASICTFGPVILAHVDLGLWPGDSAQDNHQHSIVIGGDPVICKGSHALGRTEAIAELCTDLSQGLTDALGTFAGLRVDQGGHCVQAFTDKLGVRPIYWVQTSTHIFAASAFWLLEGLPGVHALPDWQAAAETVAFGFPLGNRTLNGSISVLPPGHMLEIRDGNVQLQKYWDWSQLTPNKLKGEALLDHVEHEFHAAVDRRSQGQQTVMCFLSGGMDSRLIAVRLRESGKQVHSLNFAPAGSQDLVLGRMIAERLACHHSEYGDGHLGFVERQSAALKAWTVLNSKLSQPPQYPSLIWSGDGGSVGLGHVYLNTAIVALARQSGFSAAASALQLRNNNHVAAHILRRPWKHLAQMPLQGIERDLQSRPDVEPGRNCHLFLMLNDQRRHLTRHFETLHLHRIDLVLPFFDARFLAAVLASPIDEFLDHRLYNDLMARLPFKAGEVPWQSYPEHLPCPVAIDPALRDQWDAGWTDAEDVRLMRRAHVQRLTRDLLQARLVKDVLSMPLLKSLIWAERLGLNRFGYLLDAADPFLSASRAGDRAQHVEKSQHDF